MVPTFSDWQIPLTFPVIFSVFQYFLKFFFIKIMVPYLKGFTINGRQISLTFPVSFFQFSSIIFGSFGLSTKEPYTILLCPSSLVLVSLASALALSSVHTSPWHRIRHRNFIFGIHIHTSPPYMHIKYLVILTCSFQLAAILIFFFDLPYCLHR